MKEVIVFNDVEAAREVALALGLSAENDYSWPVPAVRILGEVSSVRGFIVYLAAVSETAVIVE